MTGFFRLRVLLLGFVGLLSQANGQIFAGSDDFSGSDTKWAYFFRPAGGANGLLTFTGSVLEFTKAAGTGSYILGWDGDANATNSVSRTPASYTTSWVMNISATNLAQAETGKFASVGIEASAAAGAYTAMLLTNLDGRLYVIGESNAIGRNVRVAAPINADVRLRLAWDAAGRSLVGSYSFDAGATFRTLMTVPISVWGTSPAATGFLLEAVGHATTAAAIPAGQMRLDNFSVGATATFVGFDDYSAGEAKWADYYQLPYLTDGTNGLLRIAGSVAEFTKGAGKGSFFAMWDGDGIAGNNVGRLPASFTTSWVMDLTATNRHVAEAGTISAIGLQVEVGASSYAEINVMNSGGTLVVRAEANSPTEAGVNVPAPINADIRLRLGWNATTRILTFSYSFNGGTSYTVARTLPISTWSVLPSAGFFFEVEAFSTSAAAIPAGQMFVDNFSITAVPQVVGTPAPLTVPPGAAVALSAPVTGSAGAAVQWQRNGTSVAGASTESLILENLQPAGTGLYRADVSNAVGAVTTPATIVGLSTTTKVVGTGSEVGLNIVHANGNVFDQVLLEGPAASIKADATQIVRMSFIDATHDIVQIEFSGAGTVSLVLDGVSGPAAPVNYNQAVTYMKGHAGIVITDADETSNLSVFSVGRANAVNQALFKDITYDGFADIAFVAIASANGKFGGVRTANASYFATKGLTGLYAPGVQFTGPVFIGDISASDAATPVLIIGSGATTQINGGDLLQANGSAVQVAGLTQLRFVQGSTSHGGLLAAQANRARLEADGVDVTTQTVVNP